LHERNDYKVIHKHTKTMLYKLALKNSKKTVLIDEESYLYLTKNTYLKQIDFLSNLRIHSHGYAFFQKNWPLKNGMYKNETIYLHKLLAEKFIEKPESDKRLMVRFKNSTPLDCRLKNLEWSTLSRVVRNTTKIKNSTGYRGVVKHSNKYQAIIYVERKPVFIGSYDTAKEAAIAYNEKSKELFGETKSLNKIR